MRYLISALAISWAICGSADPALAQSPERPKIDFEALVDATPMAADEALFVTKDGCAYLSTVSDAATKKRRESYFTWSGDCVDGFLDGQGALTDAKSSSNRIFAMGRLSRFNLKYTGNVTAFTYGDKEFEFRNIFLRGVFANIDSSGKPLGVHLPGPDGSSDNWYTEVEIQDVFGGKQIITEMLGRRVVKCTSFNPDNSDGKFVLDTKEAIKNFEAGKRGCKKNLAAKLPDGKANNRLRIVEYSVRDANTGTTTTRYYPCAYAPTIEEERKLPDDYCTAKWDELATRIKPRVDQLIDYAKARQDRIDKLAADLRVELKPRYAAQIAHREQAARQKEQEDLAKKQRAAAEARALIDGRQTAFLVANPGSAKAARPFSAPVDNGKVGVVYFGFSSDDSGSDTITVDEDKLGLAPNLPAEYAMGEDVVEQKKLFSESYAKLKAAGATTIYVFYVDRRLVWEGPLAFRPRSERILISSQVQNNPEYPQAEAEFKAADRDLDAAQRAYDAEVSRSNSGGYGTGSAALAGIGPGLAAANRLNKAQTRRRLALERLGRMKPQTKTENWATAAFGDVTYRYALHYPLVIYACDGASDLCAERERLVEHDVTVERPLLYYPGESQVELRKQQIKAADEKMFAYRDKLQFGFSTASLGSFFEGTTQKLPATKLIDYTTYADKVEEKAFEGRNATFNQQRKAVAAAVAPLYPSLPRPFQNGHILNQIVSEAAEAKREEKLQGLE